MALTDTWDAAFEALPADPGYVAMGPYRIRETKRATAERMDIHQLQTGSNWDTRGYTLGVAAGTSYGDYTSYASTAGFTYVHSLDFELTQAADVLLVYYGLHALYGAPTSAIITMRFEVDSAAQSSFKTGLFNDTVVNGTNRALVNMRMIVSNLAASTHTVAVEASTDLGGILAYDHHLTIAPIWTD